MASEQQPLMASSQEQSQDDEDGEESDGLERAETDRLKIYRTPLVVERLKAPPLLLHGALGMAMACVAVFSVAVVLFFTSTNEQYQFHYASGQGYMASTFADLTWRRSTVTGRVFVTCGLMSAFSIQSSWYVSALRNVFTGVERLHICGRYWSRWSSIRQMVPAAGLMLLVGVSSPPRAAWEESPGYSLIFGVIVHSIGGWMVFVGYSLSELQCLGYLECITKVNPDEPRSNAQELDGAMNNGANRKPRKTRPCLTPTELSLRLWCIGVSCLCAVFFIICQIVLFGLKFGCPSVHSHDRENRYVGGHCDAWVFEGDCIMINKTTKIGSFTLCTNTDDRVVEIDSAAEVINTASGLIFWVKLISLLCEFVGTFGFCFSHLLIWYYCEERHFHRYWLHDCESVRPQPEKLLAIDTALRAIVEHAPADDKNGNKKKIRTDIKWKAFQVELVREDPEVRALLEQFNIPVEDTGPPKTVTEVDWDKLDQKLEEMRSKYAHTHSNEVLTSSNAAPSDDPPVDPPAAE